MPRQYQLPVQFSDSNRCDHSSATPSFARSLLLAAVLAGYARLSHAVFLLRPKEGLVPVDAH